MKTLEKIDISFILYFGTMVYAVFFASRFFGTNDDMLMMLFVSGVYTGSPSEYIVFENILLGQFLKQLYIAFPTVNWYVFVLTAIQVFSFTALYFLMKRILDKKVLFFLFVLPTLYFVVEFNLYLQFTKVAFLAAIVGIIYIALYFHEKRNTYLVYAFIFLTVAYLVREYSVYGVVLLALPMGLFMLVRYTQQLFNIKFMVFLFLLGTTVIMLNSYNHNYYNSSKEWKNFKELIDIRGYIYYDRSITKECFFEEGKKFDISKNDVATYYKWTNDDTKVFTPELLNHIKEHCSQGTSGQFDKMKKPNFIQNFLKKLSTFDFMFMFVLFLYFFFIMPHKYKVLYVVYFSYFMGVLLYLFTMTFENRVVSSLTFEFYVFSMVLLTIVGTKKYYIYSKLVSFLLFPLFMGGTYVSLLPTVVQKKKLFDIRKELPTFKDHYIIISKSGNFFASLPLDTDFREMFKNTVYYYIGWNLSSPDNNSVLKEIKNFYELALQEENVIFYMDAHRLPVVKQYFLEHFEKKVEFYKLRDDYYKMKII